MNKIGFIGLGNMGKGMAINLSKNNLKIFGYDINEESFSQLIKNNITKCNDIKKIVEQSEIIITMLPDGKIVKAVWEEIFKYNPINKIIIDCSTIDLKTSIEIQTHANKINIETLDAPVSGGVMGADNGSLTFMVGGEESTYKKTKFLFDIMGKNSILCGAIGAGQSIKMCNNMLLAITMTGLGESLKLAKNLNLDISKFYNVLSTSSASCWAINNYFPIKGIGPTSPADNDFNGGFSSMLMLKDLGLAIEAGKASKTNLNFGKQAKNNFEKIVNADKGDLDFSNIINNLDQLN
mgnify:CR=1 FL=1